MNNEYNRLVRKLTAATHKTLPVRMLKLTNEVGELAQAVDIFEGSPGTAYRNSEDPLLDLLEEAIDVRLVIDSIITQLQSEHGFTEERVLQMAMAKIEKWGAVIGLEGEL